MAESASPLAAPGPEDQAGPKARRAAPSAASGSLVVRMPSWRALLYVSAVVLVLEIVVILLGVLWQLLLAGCCALVQLVFPSQQVTWSKILCVLGGMALSVFYCVELRLSQPQQQPQQQPQRGRSGSASNQSTLRSPRKLVVHIPAGLARISPLREDRSLSTDAASPSATPRSPPHGQSGAVLEGEFPQLTLIDDGGRLGTSAWSLTHRSWCVNSAHPIAFENEFFQGQFLLMVREQDPASELAKPTIWSRLFERKPQLLWMQVQGRFKRAPPPGARCFIAMELPSSDFSIGYWARQALEAAIAITRLFMPSLHIAFADEELEDDEHTTPAEDELPHVAFPLYQAVDEMVVTSFPDGHDKAPVLGQTASFGETPEQKAARQHVPPGQECFTTGSLYSFQFHTKYLDLPNWKLVNLPGLPDLSLNSICGHQPVRMAAYMITAPQDPAVELQPSPHSPFETHARALKKYLFGFSLHYQTKKSHGALGTLHVTIPPLLSSRSNSSSSNTSPAPLSHPSSLRLGSPFVDLRPTATSAQYPYRAEDLDRMKFELAMWVERVDPVAGKRKIAYLLTAEEQLNDSRQPAAVQIRKHVVVRSAATMKTALLLLKDDSSSDDARATSPVSPAVFKRLHVESREYLYSQIDQETELVARALQRIAASPTHHVDETYGSSEPLQHRPSSLDQLQKAVLFHCLTSPAKLPCHRSYQEIGVQWPASKRNEMRIIWEQGVYRNLFSSRFLRQEWLTVTETELLFFRSYSVKPCKAILLSDVLRVQALNHCIPELNGEGGGQDPYSMIERTSTAATNRWFCVQVHLVGEIVSFFVESETMRQQCISSLNELMHHRTCPPTRDIERESTPVRLNQRSLLRMKTQTRDDIASRLPLRSPMAPRSPRETTTPSVPAPDSPFTRVQQALSQALQVHAIHPDQRTPSDMLIVLDAVESINDIDLLDKSQWNGDHDEKHAFLLNLYHLLFIHASLVFGLPHTQSERKKMQTIPFFLLGNRDFPDRQVRVTLDNIKSALHLARVSPAFYSASHWTSTLTCMNNSDNASPGSSNGSFLSLPGHLVLDHGDFRSHFALQLNCNPAIANVMRVYHSDRLQLSEQLNQTCAAYLAHELWIDGQERVIYLPKVCEWYQDDFDVERSVRQSTTTMSSSASTAARYGSWTFVCLQLLLNLMNDEQHDLVQHMLLGAGDESQIRYNCFWTQDTGNNNSSNNTSNRNVMPAPQAPLSASTRSQSASSFLQSFF